MNSPSQNLRKWISILIFLILSLVLMAGMAPNISARVVTIGESYWPGYAKDLRTDPTPPTCDLISLTSEIAACPAEENSPPKSTGAPNGSIDPSSAPLPQKPTVDPFGDADPFSDPKPVVDPFGEADPFSDPKPVVDPFGDADPFSDPKPAVDPFGEADPFSEPVTTGVPTNCKALRSFHRRCKIRHADYQVIQSRISPGVRRFRSVETFLSALSQFPFWKHMLALLALLGASCASLKSEHICLRHPANPTEHKLSHTAQMLVHLLWVFSCWKDYQIQASSEAQNAHLELPLLWALGFGTLALIHLFHLIRYRPERTVPPSLSRLLMVVPLYTWMGLIGGFWFLWGEQHPTGQAIYLHKFTQIPNIYLGIGLYIWSGMLFSTTRIAKLFFRTLLPWGLPVPLLAWVIVALAAIPTAYSGASGIFVIAAGAVIFRQLIDAGASKRLALAATAMSGSFGVVLQPCLVVVLVAVLNKQVTTDMLFAKGLWVFGLAISILLVVLLLRSKEPLRCNPLRQAIPGSARAFVPLIPYFGIALSVLLLYGLGLKTWLNEHTAALILPVALLAMVVYERKIALPDQPGEPDQRSLWTTLVEATTESSGHVGALLLLMAASVGLGGVVERSELMSLFPSDFGGPVWAMSALVFIMILVGMTMDAMGAVVLVSVTLASVAYQNGIEPVHFWMMVLSAFELGYLTPPVAINHLLARQVIGVEARVEEDHVEGFWNRTEHIWLPIVVRGLVLVIVALVPFLWY